jgi:hypothetical protein
MNAREETYDAKYSMMSPAASNVYPYAKAPCAKAPPVVVEQMRLQELLLVLSFSSFLEDDKRAKRV